MFENNLIYFLICRAPRTSIITCFLRRGYICYSSIIIIDIYFKIGNSNT